MKKNLYLAIILLLVTASVQGQLPGKAKDLLKDKSKPKTEKESPATGTPRSQGDKPARADIPSDSGSPVSRSSGPKNSTVELDFDAEPFKAAISWESLLSQESRYFNATNGEFKLNNLDVAFLPKKNKSGQAVSYESFDNPTPVLRMDVVDAGSKELKGTLYYSASATTSPFHNMELKEHQGWPYSVKLTEGSYELHFWAGTTHFYTFPLRVEILTNADPDAPVSTFYHFRGPWEEWGYVNFGPDGHFIFNFYHTYQTTEVENAARWDVRKEFKTVVKLNREGKMIAVYRMGPSTADFEWNTVMADNCVWKKFDMTFHNYPPPAGHGNRPFFLKDNMKDGNYSVDVVLKDEKSGKETTYKYGFSVKDGKIVQADKADRSKNPDALQFLEQGRDKFFVKRIQ
ncbi:MAG: hypothetical protein IPN76_24710 [Saprospiraceae bacterium]|nr:hypothetical protein [Saprospiraceae bacterium]